jgi:hypothetical protein
MIWESFMSTQPSTHGFCFFDLDRIRPHGIAAVVDGALDDLSALESDCAH